MRPTEADALRTILNIDCDNPTGDQLAALEDAQPVIARLLAAHDKREDRKTRNRDDRKQRRQVRQADWWTLPRAQSVVRNRAGGHCELQGPACQGRAREVHHVNGRVGVDPHDPAGLLGLCGHGNQDGCHGWVHQTAEGREAARRRAAEIADREGYAPEQKEARRGR